MFHEDREKFKPEPSRQAREEGLKINPEFCNWHFELVQMIGSCDVSSCPLSGDRYQHLFNSKDLVLAEGVTLGSLINFMGKENWDLFKDHPPTIAHELARLRQCEPMSHLQLEHLDFQESAGQKRRLGKAAELLSRQLKPLLTSWADGDEAEEAIYELLVDLGPGTLELGLPLLGFLRSYFQSLTLLRQMTDPLQIHSQEMGLQKTASENNSSQLSSLFEAISKGHDAQKKEARRPIIDSLENGKKCANSMMQGLEYLKESSLLVFGGDPSHGGEQFRALVWRNLKACCSEDEMNAIFGGVSSSRTSDLLFGAFLKALPPMDHCENWFEGLMEILQDEPPRDPLEAIVRFQLYLCHFTATWLAYPEENQTIRGLKEDLRGQFQKTELAHRKALRQWVAQRDRWLEN